MLDLEVDDLPPSLAELHSKVAEYDPYIQGLRVARNRPGVVRVVLDLKGEVKPQAFTLKPIAEYGYRLVLDIYPAGPGRSAARPARRDEEAAGPVRSSRPKAVARLATVVIDPGHGGEDPGAHRPARLAREGHHAQHRASA